MIFQFIQSIITPLVSILSIFISNWLGRRAVRDDYRLKTKEKAYRTFYIPLMKLLLQANQDYMTYYWFVASNYMTDKQYIDPFNRLLTNNLEYLSPLVIPHVHNYSIKTNNAKLFFNNGQYRYEYEDSLVDASDEFDIIIKLALEQARLLARELGYPDIAAPILEAFETIVDTDINYPRHLPKIYQTSHPILHE